jgi:hypothetical protein
MKIGSTIFVVTMLLSVNSLATTKFVCREKSDAGNAISVVLESQDKKSELNKEGSKIKATLEIYDTEKKKFAIDNLLPTTSAKGIVEFEDVNLYFTSEDKKINLTIYLDGLTESIMSLEDGEDINLTCF